MAENLCPVVPASFCLNTVFMFRIYNTFSREKEECIPLHSGKIGMYVCGPTVYNYTHIGNLKAFINADVLRRYLEYLGYEVRMIKNITDVGHLTNDDISQGDTGEDKMYKASKREHVSPEEIANRYEQYFHDAEEKLNIEQAHFFPRATAHIPHMIRLIEKLIKKGHAYVSNGNVFYDIETFPSYGSLSGNSLEKLHIGSRLSEEHPDKKHQWDFALWLKAAENHIMRWESPWSVGYPGWHIECSAMSMEYLGDTIDIHTGGEDHIFPHHEAEKAQSEGVTEKQFVRYWVHERHMLVDGVKMSKSKGNFYRMEDITDRGYSAMDVRMLMIASHYRSQMNFTWTAMDQARKNFDTLMDVVCRIEESAQRQSAGVLSDEIQKIARQYRKNFEVAMNDDLNMPLALSELYDYMKRINTYSTQRGLSGLEAKYVLETWNKTNSVFGFKIDYNAKTREVPADVVFLAEERKKAREEQDFVRADTLRSQIAELGYNIEDTIEGYSVKKIS
jgi:cysteinyl-tRNA synthetase